MTSVDAQRVAVAMLGARMHYAVPRLLHEAGLLERFFTDSYVGNKPWLEFTLQAIPRSLRPARIVSWLGRKDAVLPASAVTSFELLGLWYARARARARGEAAENLVYREGAERFNRRIIAAGFGDAEFVWGFNGASLEMFEAAKREGRRCVLEQTILPKALRRRLLAEEQRRWPGWEAVPSEFSAPTAMDGREEAEWALADAIVVGSEFVGAGLRSLGVDPGKIHLVPYGVDPGQFGSASDVLRPPPGDRPLRLLFAGEVGLRKGVPDLLHALRSFAPGELSVRLAGGLSLSREKIAPFRPWAEFPGHVPRSRMPALFQSADVFVLPSIVEGSATVTYEAITAGCPVIATPNAGSIIQDGVDGFVVPIRDPEAIAAAIRRYREEPGLLESHRGALVRTRERAGLARYKADLIQLFRGLADESVNGTNAR